MSELNCTPDWVKHAVFYQIFPDRFAKSEDVIKPDNFESWDSAPSVYGFKGGDLLGVYEKLDYLEDLGITAIYLNPIFQSASNHRYHTHDYYQVDPLLGGNAALKVLLKAAHHRNMRIVLDGVFNHASRGFYQFNHILETGEQSPYLHWFDIHGFPVRAYHGKPNYRCWWSLPALPEFNTDNPQVRKYLLDIARYWIDEGIDGWRLDVPFEIDDDDFWREFRSVVKAGNPEAYIVGEIPSEAQRWLRGDMFDGVMNYQFTLMCLQFFGGKGIDQRLAEGMMGFSKIETMDAPAFLKRSAELFDLYPVAFSQAQLNLLDSHDMPRFLSLVRLDRQRLYLASVFQMTYPGAPCVYYGDEIGLSGGKDPECRKAFPWDEANWDHGLRGRIKELIELRHAIPALRMGSYEPVLAEAGLIAFLRRDAEECVMVMINTDVSAHKVRLEVGGMFEDGTELQDQLGELHVRVTNGALQDLDIPGMSAVVLA